MTTKRHNPNGQLAAQAADSKRVGRSRRPFKWREARCAVCGKPWRTPLLPPYADRVKCLDCTLALWDTILTGRQGADLLLSGGGGRGWRKETQPEE